MDQPRADSPVPCPWSLHLLAIVIPTLNAAETLLRCLQRLREGTGRGLDILVSDGGSEDATQQIAQAAGARLLIGPPGRGQQLRLGVAATSAPWILILHADSLLPPGWAPLLSAFIADPRHAGCAGYGRLAFDEPGPAARRVAALANWRARVLALPYGDQALLLPRTLYDAVGGFRPIPLMEDVALVRAIGRARLRPLPLTVTTSAERYRRDGWYARPARNLLCLGLYFAGVAPERIAGLYARR